MLNFHNDFLLSLIKKWIENVNGWNEIMIYSMCDNYQQT
jgi:hypothetical protein